MREAIRQARKGLGLTSPNPPVGAVIARGGRIVAKGHHRKAGGPHAEIDCLESLPGKAQKRDTLYVTLEPCNHFGKTPPCTNAILKSGIRRVVVGTGDPNPNVSGGGCRHLAEEGVEVVKGVLEAECRRLIEGFSKFARTGLPFVAAKSALTLDGWTATSAGSSKWITGESSRRFVHRLRQRVDAVMVGVGTVITDDPSLTVRLGHKGGKNPMRIIVDTHLRIRPDARLFREAASAPTLIAVGETVSRERFKPFEENGAALLVCPEKEGRVDLAAMMARLGEMDVTSILLEGGSTLMGAMIRQGLVDKFYIFKAPMILGGGDGIPMASGQGPLSIDGCLRLREITIRRFGEDVLIEGYPEYQRPMMNDE
jgi:diaminohydroxyphosphoribosylaminopyrimidine deaminase/5-amino-6-(5-phosphoribosylamino)uracil reductase